MYYRGTVGYWLIINPHIYMIKFLFFRQLRLSPELNTNTNYATNTWRTQYCYIKEVFFLPIGGCWYLFKWLHLTSPDLCNEAEAEHQMKEIIGASYSYLVHCKAKYSVFLTELNTINFPAWHYQVALHVHLSQGVDELNKWKWKTKPNQVYYSE